MDTENAVERCCCCGMELGGNWCLMCANHEAKSELSRLRAENAELRQDREILVDLYRSNSRNYSLYKPDEGRRHVEEYLAHIKARAVLAKQNAPGITTGGQQ